MAAEILFFTEPHFTHFSSVFRMIKKHKKKIKCIIDRKMLNWSHYSFKNRIYLVSKHYISKLVRIIKL